MEGHIKNITFSHSGSGAFFPIYVIVVESHQHALEHIHAVLRRRKRRHSLANWSLMHFDAHPDLACPGPHVPAGACFTPRKVWPVRQMDSGKDQPQATPKDGPEGKNLYELLDETSSGIAEWILPLVLAGDLSVVHWVRSRGSHQLPLGQCKFRVGAWIPRNSDMEDDSSCEKVSSFLDLPPPATMKVDLNHPYYLDDSSVVPSEELLLPQTLLLIVSELPEEVTDAHIRYATDGTGVVLDGSAPNRESARGYGWALDICLDYFACLNPFLVDLEKHSPEFAKALLCTVTQTTFHTIATNPATFTVDKGFSYEEELVSFRSSIRELLRTAIEYYKHLELTKQGIRKDSERTGLRASKVTFKAFYETEQVGENVLDGLLQSLWSSKDPPGLAAMALDALPSITMPHHPPENESLLRQSVFERLQVVVEHIRQTRSGSINDDPFIITICRSAIDGFTPDTIVEDLQSALLCRLHTMFCGCDCLATMTDNVHVTPEQFSHSSEESRCCRWKVIFDYGYWEGSSFDEH